MQALKVPFWPRFSPLRRMTCTNSAVPTTTSAPTLGMIDAREPVTNYESRWNNIWEEGVPKGQFWDRSSPSPCLVHLLSSGRLGDLSDKHVLVPGCGRGYDLVAFAGAGAASVMGLEISTSAVQEARAYLKEFMAAPGITQASAELGDFFSWQYAHGQFDVGYDYTFGCAMHPNDRKQWASNWARLLKKDATLVTLIFPVDPSMDPNMGPPFPVTPDLYSELLLPAGFEQISLDKVSVELSHQGRQGKEYLGLWRRA